MRKKMLLIHTKSPSSKLKDCAILKKTDEVLKRFLEMSSIGYSPAFCMSAFRILIFTVSISIGI